MKPALLLVLIVSIAGDILVFAASSVLLTKKRLIDGLARYATPFAAGALLAAAFLDFLHDGVEHYNPLTVLTAALIGIIFFFLLEGWLHWFHHHSVSPMESSHEHERDPITVLVTLGNWIHNFIDGAAIAAAFLISVPTGVITTIAVALHEIPREVADSGYLLRRGMGRRGVIMVHGAAIGITAIGTTIFYLLAGNHTTVLAWLVGSTAGFFIYVAVSDIIPSINATRDKGKVIDYQSSLLVIGTVIVGAAILIAHHFIG
jgi:zinc and cadmium transporter